LVGLEGMSRLYQAIRAKGKAPAREFTRKNRAKTPSAACLVERDSEAVPGRRLETEDQKIKRIRRRNSAPFIETTAPAGFDKRRRQSTTGISEGSGAGRSPAPLGGRAHAAALRAARALQSIASL
jgi:hypothetical protein